MPENFKIVIPGKLYRSGQIAPSEIKSLIISPYNVVKFVTLDQQNSIAITPYIPKNVQNISIPLLTGNASIEARNLATQIRSGLLDSTSGAVLVSCSRGMDRTGLAIALYKVIKQGQNCIQVIDEAKSIGYGSGIPADTLTQYNMEICRSCTFSHKHYVQISKSNDVSQADDIVNEMRDDFSHQDGWNSVGAIPTGASTEYSFAPFSDSTVEGPFGSKSASRKARKSLLKKIIKLIDKKEDNNEAMLLPDSGLIDNYKGMAADQFGAPSASPGSPNAGGYVDPGGLVQL